MVERGVPEQGVSLVRPTGPARASGLGGARDVGVLERASTDAERSIPLNRRLLPDHGLVAHRVNGRTHWPCLRPAPRRPRHVADDGIPAMLKSLLFVAWISALFPSHLCKLALAGPNRATRSADGRRRRVGYRRIIISLFRLLRPVLSGNVHQIASTHQHTSDVLDCARYRDRRMVVRLARVFVQRLKLPRQRRGPPPVRARSESPFPACRAGSRTCGGYA